MSHGSTAKVQLENEFFKVTEWTIEPLGHIPMHKHEYEYVVIPMMTGQMHVKNADGSQLVSNLVQGESYTRPSGGEHRIENPSETKTVVFVEVERLH